MAKECLICGKSMGALTGKVNIIDGYVCIDCWLKAGFDKDTNSFLTGKQYTSSIIKEMISVKENNKQLIDNFQPTKVVGNLSFDDNTKSFTVKTSKKNTDLYYYSQLQSFELLENGESITKGGLGGAAVGAVLLGPVGAIVGGITGGKKNKGVCNSLQIKITLRDSLRQTIYIPFITVSTKMNGIIYKNAYQTAQDTLSALQLAVDILEQNQTKTQNSTIISGADEILKYKQLLDDGIITEEEFQVKKKQILGL